MATHSTWWVIVYTSCEPGPQKLLVRGGFPALRAGRFRERQTSVAAGCTCSFLKVHQQRPAHRSYAASSAWAAPCRVASAASRAAARNRRWIRPSPSSSRISRTMRPPRLISSWMKRSSYWTSWPQPTKTYSPMSWRSIVRVSDSMRLARCRRARQCGWRGRRARLVLAVSGTSSAASTRRARNCATMSCSDGLQLTPPPQHFAV